MMVQSLKCMRYFTGSRWTQLKGFCQKKNQKIRERLGSGWVGQN